MTAPVLRIEPEMQRDVWDHFTRSVSGVEEAGFAYAVPSEDTADMHDIVEWAPVTPEGFVSRSAFHLELTDKARATAVKRAHDLGASLVELHSHLQYGPARFSWSDQKGFHEFVPHVWWRLKAKPYFAIVIAGTSFDGLAWMRSPEEPVRLGGLSVGSTVLTPTHHSSLGDREWSNDD